jgi:uncharacterized membrane protein
VDQENSFGGRVADKITAYIGSWSFIIAQAILMFFWGAINTLAFCRVIQFDPYPFVFLNLFMSAEAAFSTPLILMSQNRADARYRHHVEQVNNAVLLLLTRMALKFNIQIEESVSDLADEAEEELNDD